MVGYEGLPSPAMFSLSLPIDELDPRDLYRVSIDYPNHLSQLTIC